MSNIKDLADYDHPVSDMFQLPKSAAEWGQYKLSDEQLLHFKEYGYVSGIKFCSIPSVIGVLPLACMMFYGTQPLLWQPINCWTTNPLGFGTTNYFVNRLDMAA